MRHLLIPSLILASICSNDCKAAGDIKLKLFFQTAVSGYGVQLPLNGELDFIIKSHDVDVYTSEFGHLKYVGSKSVGHGDFFGPIVFNVQASGHQLNFTGTYKTHVESARITTDGVSQCHAALSVRLRPGFDHYEFNVGGANVNLTGMHYTGVRCELSTT